jgi:hypothetical protein
MIIYGKHLKNLLNNENIQKLFLQKKSYSIVVLKTYLSNHYFKDCGRDEKVNLCIFPFLFAQKCTNWYRVSQFTRLADDVSLFSYV